jgi:DNA-binding transcriptional regulator YdaS (Cro superfamily)
MKSLASDQQRPLQALLKAIIIAGGQSCIARKCDVKPQTIQVWLKLGRVPAERVLQIEKIVNKEVSRHELRPDIYPIDE